MWGWVVYNAVAATWTNPQFEIPSIPLQEYNSATYTQFDIQVHNRDHVNVWDGTIDAQHGSACQGPPATHPVNLLSDAVFICNGHIMTAAWGIGYGEIVLTPSQILDCSFTCTVQWDMSTERLSARDWPDMWLTPWSDNLTLPFDEGNVDLQGMPRQGIHVNLQDGINGAFRVGVISNYTQNYLPYDFSVGISQGIPVGVNQAAVRQTFKLTLMQGHVKFERLASATATAVTWVDTACTCFMASDYVVQFGHHSYNPTKENAGIPATWHWFGNPNGLILSNATPFTLIHSTLKPGEAITSDNTLLTFNAPAPNNAYLRFSAECAVNVDGKRATRQTFAGFIEHASSYFVSIPQGTQSVNITFSQEPTFNVPCYLQDAAIWAKSGNTPSTPTPTPTPVQPTPTTSPLPSTPTPIPVVIRRQCTLRWGNTTIENYGLLTQAQCAARGN